MASATLIALFLLSALTFYAPSTTAQLVKDWNGKIINNGGRVYILPSLIGAPGGGVRRFPTGNESFPLSVVQSPFKDDKGLPVTISTLYPNTYIPEGAVSLGFVLGVTPLEWTAVEGLPEGTLVKTRGYPSPIIGSFYIRKSKFGRINSYNLEFCRGLTNIILLCGNVSIVENDGNLLLAVTQNNPHEFYLEQYLPTSADA